MQPENVELRGEIPRWIIDTLDAVAMSQDKTRIAIVSTILEQWARQKIHEATLINRVVQFKPVLPASVGHVVAKAGGSGE